MSDAFFFDALRHALWTAVKMATPLLSVALLTGLIIGLIQALTSVQEMTLTFVPKISAMLAVFWASMSFMTSSLVNFYTAVVLPTIAGG